MYIRRTCTHQKSCVQIHYALLTFFVFFLASQCKSFIKVESVIPGIDKQPVNATLIDAIPVISAISPAFAPFNNEEIPDDSAASFSSPESIYDNFEEDNIIGELIPFAPINACDPLQQSIFTTNTTDRVTFDTSLKSSSVIVLIELNSGNCTLDRKLMMAQRVPSVIGVVLIGLIPQQDQDTTLRSVKSRLVVFSVSEQVGETLVGLTNWYRQHRIVPLSSAISYPTLNGNSIIALNSSISPDIINQKSSKEEDDAWIRATLMTGIETYSNLGVLEFALLIVVVLLAISFLASIALHFYLFHSRDQRGINLPQVSQGQVLPESYLQYLPIRQYDDLLHKQSSEASKPPPVSSEGDLNDSSLDEEEPKQNEISPSPSVRSSSSWIINAIRNSINYLSFRNDQNTSNLFNDTCPVCLDDFTPKARVRELPCQHIFHPECIDSWLVNRASSCPMCKFDCYNTIKKILDQNEQESPRTFNIFKKIKLVLTKFAQRNRQSPIDQPISNA